MTSKRETVPLGEIFDVSNTRLGSHAEEPPVFAISKYDGVVLGSEYHDRRIASQNLGTYKVVDPQDWAYSTIHIDEGSIARSGHSFSGVVSPMYTILKWKATKHDARYFELLLRSPEMLAIYGDMAQGSINRRRSLPWKTFSSIEVTAPPLAEQRRIVDLIDALDDAIEGAETKRSSASSLASAARSTVFNSLSASGTSATAGILFEVTLGRQKSARQLHGDNELPYLRAANILPGGLHLRDVNTMHFDPREQEKYSLRVGDVLVVEGGSVGQTSVWNGEVEGPVCFDKHVLRLRGVPGRSLTGYAKHWATWCYETGRFQAEALGATILALGFQRVVPISVV